MRPALPLKLASALGVLLLLALPLTAFADFELSEASLAEAIAQVLPLVEKETRTPLAGKISIRLASREELRKVIMKEALVQMRIQFKDEETVKLQAKSFARLISVAALAKYAFEEKAVLVSRENFIHLSGLCREPLLLSPEGLRAVLVHECVHAADDLHYGFSKKIETLKTLDALQAFSGVIEGHAQFLARKICRAGSWTAGFEAFTRSIGAMPEDESLGEGMRALIRIMVVTLSTSYYQGEKFIAALYRAGGEQAVEKAFTAPPAEQTLLFHPQWFLDPKTRPVFRFDFDKALDRVSASLEGEKWTSQKVSINPSQVAAALNMLPEKDIQRIVKNLKINHCIVLQPASAPGSKMVVASVSIMSSPPEALFYMAAAERLARMKDEKMKTGSIRILSSDYVPVHTETCQGVYYDKKISAYGMESRVRGLLAIHGRIAIEFIYSVQPIDLPALQTLVKKMCRALQVEEKD